MQIDPFELLHIGPFKSKHTQTDGGYAHPLTADHFVQIDLLVLRLNDSEDSVNTLTQKQSKQHGTTWSSNNYERKQKSYIFIAYDIPCHGQKKERLFFTR